MWNSIPITLANSWRSSIVNRLFLQTLSFNSSVMTDRCPDQASLFACPPSIKQMTPLSHNPHVYDTFPIYFNKLAMDFGRVNVFHVQKSNHWMHFTISEISDWHGSLQRTDTATNSLTNTAHLAEGLMTALNLQKLPAWVGCENDGKALKWPSHHFHTLPIFHVQNVFSFPAVKPFGKSSLILNGMAPFVVPVNFVSPSPTVHLNICNYGLFFSLYSLSFDVIWSWNS
jgi:hypothetical protein